MGEPVQERSLPLYEMYTNHSDSRHNKTVVHENALSLERSMPIANTDTNRSYIQRNTESYQTTNYGLPPTLKKESFSNSGVMPRYEREVNNGGRVREVSNTMPVRSNTLMLQDYMNSQQFDRW
jgi:hypothetical protein